MARVQFDYAGETVLITGASSGIGSAAALKFAGAGANVVLADIAEADGERMRAAIIDGGGKAVFKRTDVRDADECERLVAFALSSFGRLDAAFNNAGIFGRAVKAADASQEDWSRVVDINLSGVFNCMRSELAAMKAGGGTIVNNASVIGLVGGAGAAAYSASKHGVIGLTKSAAIDHGRHGVRVNAICPGFVSTPMTVGHTEFPRGVVAIASERSALRRLGEADEIADAVLWLCSGASSFVTGAAIVVDGGYLAS